MYASTFSRVLRVVGDVSGACEGEMRVREREICVGFGKERGEGMGLCIGKSSFNTSTIPACEKWLRSCFYR